MKQKEMEDIINRRYRKIDKLFKKVTRKFDMEDIHDFRVEVKKLRAFLHLMGGGDPSIFKLPGKLHQFYRAAGEIRHIQLQEQEIQMVMEDKYYILPEAYLQYLRQQKASNIGLAREIGNKKKLLKKTGLLQHLPGRLSHSNMKEFVQSRAGFLLNGRSALTEDDLHAIRKSLKDILYTWAFLDEDAAMILSPALFTDRKEIERITTLLGDFQDLRSRLSLLQLQHLRLVPLPRERESLLEMRKGWLHEKISIRKEINSLLREKRSRILADQHFVSQ